jgi:hypothetical protein
MKNSSIVVVGRKRIARELGRSPRPITRWLQRGLLPASKAGPLANHCSTYVSPISSA